MAKDEETHGGSGGGLSTDLLAAEGVAAEKVIADDLKLVGRAVREGWMPSKEIRKDIMERLSVIIKKPTCDVMTKQGPVALDGPADTNAIRAASVVVGMTGQDQTDHWNADKNARLDDGKATERIEGVEFVVPGLPKP